MTKFVVIQIGNATRLDAELHARGLEPVCLCKAHKIALLMARCRREFARPPVFKWDGLRGGKGVFISETWDDFRKVLWEQLR